jgi:hypothetical protein
LFDYAANTSTETFTMHNFPPEQPPGDVPGTIPVNPASEKDAQEACKLVRGETAHANCVFDVRLTGNPGFATTCLLSQSPKTRTHYPSKR